MQVAADEKPTRYAKRRAGGKQPVSLELPEDLHAQVREQCVRENRPFASVARQAFREYLDVHAP